MVENDFLHKWRERGDLCTTVENALIGCDGKSALVALQRGRDDINANVKHADLLSIITNIWVSLTMKSSTY